LSSFHQHAATHDLIEGNPTVGARRPKVNPDYTTSVGLDRDETRALLTAADTNPGPHRYPPSPRSGCCCTTTLRVDELGAAPSRISSTTADTGSCG